MNDTLWGIGMIAAALLFMGLIVMGVSYFDAAVVGPTALANKLKVLQDSGVDAELIKEIARMIGGKQ